MKITVTRTVKGQSGVFGNLPDAVTQEIWDIDDASVAAISHAVQTQNVVVEQTNDTNSSVVVDLVQKG